MPYIFNASVIPTTDSPVVGFLRALLVSQALILTDEEYGALPRDEQRYFEYIASRPAQAYLERRAVSIGPVVRPLSNGAIGAMTGRWTAAEAQQTVNAVRAADAVAHAESASRTRRPSSAEIRQNPPRFPGAVSHSNEGDIEPEDL